MNTEPTFPLSLVITAYTTDRLGDIYELLESVKNQTLKNMETIFSALIKIVALFPNYKVIFPVHLNPAIQQLAKEKLGKNSNIKLIDPLNVYIQK